MIIVKLGGSFVTYKGTDSNLPMRWDETDLEYRIREDLIIKVAGILKDHIDDGLILVHGGGTHGHRTVVRWRSGIARGKKIMMPWEVKWRMVQLSERIVRLLGKGGIPAVSVSPGDLILADDGSIHSFDVSSLERYVERGVVPVMRGDLVPDISGDWSVVSGDDMIFEISRLSKEGILPDVKRVILCMKEDGFYRNYGTGNQRLMPEITPEYYHGDYRQYSVNVEDMNDVSGGIYGKVAIAHRIASMNIPVNLIGGDEVHSDMAELMGGGSAGTLVVPFTGENRCRTGQCGGTSEGA